MRQQDSVPSLLQNGDGTSYARQKTSRRIGLGLSFLCVAIGLATLILGWLFDLDVFKRIQPGYPAMVPETALCVIAGGVAIHGRLARKLRIVPALLAGFIWLIVLVGLSRVFHPLAMGNGATRDAMSLATAGASLTLATGLLAMCLPNAFGRHTITLLGTLGITISAVPMLGYLFNADALFATTIYTEMALHTAITLFLLNLALLLAQPNKGWVRTILADQIGGEMIRHLIPVIVTGPITFTMTALIASRHDIFNPDMRAAILTYIMIAATFAAAVIFARQSNAGQIEADAVRRKLREIERAHKEQQIATLRSQHAEGLGKLVGGVAHDFNNTLAVIMGNLQLFDEDPDDDKHKEYLQAAINAARQGADLTSQLLAYGRKSMLNPVEARSEDLIDSAMRMFSRLRPANLALSVEIRERNAIVHVDGTGFQQALLNLLINARDAQPHGGSIHVETCVTDLDREDFLDKFPQSDLMSGRYVAIKVKDTGPGLKPEEIARVTEPFYTTKKFGDGSGLGLSVVEGFCRQSGGDLTQPSRRRAGGHHAVALCPHRCRAVLCAAPGGRDLGGARAQHSCRRRYARSGAGHRASVAPRRA